MHLDVRIISTTMALHCFCQLSLVQLHAAFIRIYWILPILLTLENGPSLPWYFLWGYWELFPLESINSNRGYAVLSPLLQTYKRDFLLSDRPWKQLSVKNPDTHNNMILKPNKFSLQHFKKGSILSWTFGLYWPWCDVPWKTVSNIVLLFYHIIISCRQKTLAFSTIFSPLKMLSCHWFKP